MLMLLKSAAPSVQDGQAPQFSPEALRITRDVHQGLRDGAKEQAVEHARIGEDQWAQVPW
jgi:hypothetical protein